MKKQTISRLALLLVLVLLASLLAGCSVTSESAEVSTASADEISETGTSDSDPGETAEEALSAEDETGEVSMAEQFAGQRIGVVTGSVYDQYVNEQIPETQVEYFNAVADMALALDTGRISAYVLDKPSATMLFQEYQNQGIYTTLTDSSYAFVFPKNSEKADLIREQMNEFLAKIQADGTAAQMEEIWFGTDESLKVVDYSGLTGENGTLNFGTSTDVGVPFTYVKDGQYIGYDIDMAVRFCREYGYNINIVDSYLSGFLANISTGKCDFGAASIAVTPERQESMDFSDPNYTGGILLIANKEDIPGADTSADEESDPFESLQGKTVGVLSGSSYENYFTQYMPESQTAYYDSVPELASALDEGSISAYILEEPAANLMFLEHENQGIYTILDTSDYAFLFQKDTEESDALRSQMNEYLAEIRADGTMDLLEEIWFGSDVSLQVVDMEGLTGENGTLDFAVCTDVGIPFAYVKDGQYAGYDVDMAVRFCREYGYGINIVDSYFSGFLASVTTGECDFGASSVAVTAEREKTLSFSDPNYTANIVLVTNQDDIPASELSLSEQASYEALRGQKIGVVTGMISDVIAEENIPDCQVEYYSGNADLALALNTGKIDAYIADEPIFRLLHNTYPNSCIYRTIFENGYGYIFQKDDEKSDLLREQMNTFLQKLQEDGTLQELDDIWFGTDETKQTVDYSGLTGENGTLSFATTSSTGEPFCYLKDDTYVGYDIDIVVRFCTEYGYGLKIVDSDFNGMLANVTFGKCDFGGSCITITEERKEAVNFSDPNYTGGLVLVVKDSEALVAGRLSEVSDASVYEQYRGCKIAVLTGTVFDAVAAETIPDCERVLYNSNSDTALALETGKVDGYITDEPIALVLMNEYEDHEISAMVRADDYYFVFQKDSEESDALRAQINEFLQTIRENGTMETLKEIWTGTEEETKVVDYSGLTGENGTIRYASSTAIGAPFFYVKDEQYVGYEMDIVVRFCREYGYALEIVDSDFNGILANVSSGKCDFGGGAIALTAERQETLNYSNAVYEGGVVLVTKSQSQTDKVSIQSIYDSIKGSFTKTFLRENRWKLFVGGIGVTLLITVIAAVCGTALAFLLFLLYRKDYKFAKILVDVMSDILQKTPVVVILMILYYVIFGKLSLDSMWVSCVGFSLIFTGSVIGLLKVAVGAVDDGQMEAALALGYTDTRAFLRVILPQTLVHFLPGYKSELVALIKGTAVVGYIAVQDLTKVSDIVRSRTYEAFFPLIATAVIYYALAWILTLLVNRVQLRTNPKRRRKEDVLKGVTTK